MKAFYLTLMIFSVLHQIIWSHSSSSVKQNIQDLKEFCKGRTLDFCSKFHMEFAMAFLENQLEQIRINVEKTQQEEKKAQIMQRKNRVRNEKMLLKLRQHFLDRHL